MTTAAPRCSVLLRHAFTHSAGCLGRGRSLRACDARSGLAEGAGSRFKPDPGPVLGPSESVRVVACFTVLETLSVPDRTESVDFQEWINDSDQSINTGTRVRQSTARAKLRLPHTQSGHLREQTRALSPSGGGVR